MKETELRHYRNQLVTLGARVRGELERMAENVRSGDRPAGEHDNTVSEAVDKELLLEHNEETIQQQIREALQRIDDGRYGICCDCGEAIPHARLDALPYTPYCTGCQRHHEYAFIVVGGAMENPEIAKIFEEIADLLAIQGANPFRVRAYRVAARTIRDLSEPVSK